MNDVVTQAPASTEALKHCITTLMQTTTDDAVLKTALGAWTGNTGVATEKTFATKSRGTSRSGSGTSRYHESAKAGDAFIAEHVERLRQLGERLPPDQEKAEKHVRQTFKKSPHVYRENPDSSWGLLKRTR